MVQTKNYQSVNKVDMSIEQANGIYFVHLISKEGKSVVLKVVKEN